MIKLKTDFIGQNKPIKVKIDHICENKPIKVKIYLIGQIYHNKVKF